MIEVLSRRAAPLALLCAGACAWQVWQRAPWIAAAPRLPDTLSVRVRVFAAADGRLVDEVRIDCLSRPLAWGGDHPQDLLPLPLGDYVAALFGGGD